MYVHIIVYDSTIECERSSLTRGILIGAQARASPTCPSDPADLDPACLSLAYMYSRKMIDWLHMIKALAILKQYVQLDDALITHIQINCARTKCYETSSEAAGVRPRRLSETHHMRHST